MPNMTSKLVNVETHILSQQMLHPGASGDFTITLPEKVDGNTSFSCYNGVALGKDDEAKAYIYSGSGSVTVTGFYKMKEVQ